MMEEVMVKIQKVDDTDVVYEKVSTMMDKTNQEVLEKVEAQD
jgi:hypothetical protein